jgi:hypothetical protein
MNRSARRGGKVEKSQPVSVKKNLKQGVPILMPTRFRNFRKDRILWISLFAFPTPPGCFGGLTAR